MADTAVVDDRAAKAARAKALVSKTICSVYRAKFFIAAQKQAEEEGCGCTRFIG
jgi:hypothetical protein